MARGNNLSQVFVANTPILETGTTFNGIASTPEIGIWNLAGNSGTGAYVNSALYNATIDTDGDTGVEAIANPLWNYNELQFVQGVTSGNPVATPIINTADIKAIRYEPYSATVRHKQVLTDAGSLTFAHDIMFKFVIRTVPTDYVNFITPNNSIVDLSGGGKTFPLGGYNSTNHKLINVEVTASEYTSFATLVDKLVTRIQAHKLLNDIVTITDNTTNATIEARHAGVIFDLVIIDGDGDNLVASSGDAIAIATTAAVVGVGNDWQVLGEERRCRARYADWNRMYLPMDFPTFTNTGEKYDRISILYAHNHPDSTGIAPAQSRNEVVLYFTNIDGTAIDSADTTATYDNAFGISVIGTAQSFNWGV